MDGTDLKLTAKSWTIALLLSAEARLIRALDAFDRAVVRFHRWQDAYEERARARLHAPDLNAALKELHQHAEDLEKRLYIDETAAANRARALLAKLGA
jgi:tetratricopeptide (TPR) repeat protein